MSARKRRAAQGEQQQDDGRNDHGLERHAALVLAVAPLVSPLNSGISETGSTTTKKTTKNFSGCSSMVLCAKMARRGET